MQTTTPRRRYDHRVRQAVVATRNVRLFPELGIPVSTARTWLTRGSPRVVSAANTGPDDVPALHAEIAVLRAKAEMYLAIASVLLVIVRGFRLDLGATRVPEARERRVEANRSRTCGACTEDDLSSDSKGVALAVA